MTECLASFAAGCFWGVESRFRAIPGVTDAPVGYMGGQTDHPTYSAVCTGTSGHAEVVQVSYDPEIVTYRQLLEAFFDMHNPTTLNRQGPDRGTQYRSAIFYHDEDQKDAAQLMVSELGASEKWQGPVVTEVSPVTQFWLAEEYHQRYLEKNGGGFCHV